MKDYQTNLDHAWLVANFRYVKSSGLFIRRTAFIGYRGGIRHPVGSVAGSLHSDGYIYIGINKRLYLAHRLAFFYVDGVWPEQEVDHKNGVRSDNRWSNIRRATIAQNRRNTLGQRTRGSEYPGVYSPAARPGRWIAQIKCDGKTRYLGTFINAELARDARIREERKLFGEFAGSMR